MVWASWAGGLVVSDFFDKESNMGGGGGGGGGGVFFYKLIRNPNLTIFLCLCVEGGGGEGNVHA